MAFSTACSKSVLDHLRRWLLLLVFVPAVAWTAEIDITNPQLLASEDGYVLTADFKFELSPRLEEAVTKGVVLASRSQTYRLSYHALTRQYRLSTGGLHQSFQTLTEATQVLSRLRNWTVVDKNDKSVRAGEPYEASLRMRLDITQLPRPFQITALGNKDWSLSSDWKRWPVNSLPAAPQAEAR